MVVRVRGGATYALAMVLWAGLGRSPARAQDVPAAARSTTEALHALADQAGSIFSGQVTAVRRQNAAASDPGVVEIDFAVDDTVRGVTGDVYTVREWGGLWRLGAEPFRVGQRYLLLLHAPGPGGLSSPVDGMSGAIPIRGTGPAVGPFVAPRPLSGTDAQTEFIAPPRLEVNADRGGSQLRRPYTGVLLPNPSDDRVADLRWVATRVVRPVPYPTQPPPRPGSPPGAGTIGHGPFLREERAGFPTEAIGQGVSSAAAVANSPTISYATVLQMLHTWEEERNAMR